MHLLSCVMQLNNLLMPLKKYLKDVLPNAWSSRGPICRRPPIEPKPEDWSWRSNIPAWGCPRPWPLLGPWWSPCPEELKGKGRLISSEEKALDKKLLELSTRAS